MVVAGSADAAPAGDITVKECIATFERAQIQQKKGELVEAMESFGACAAVDCPSAVKADCAQGREQTERAVPTVSFVVRDVSGRDIDAPLALDGKRLAVPRGRAVPLDPGDHVVRSEQDGKIGKTVFTAHEGEKSRVIAIQLEPAPPGPAREPDPAAAEARAPGASEPTVTGGSASRSVGPWIVGAAGIIAVAIGGGLYVSYRIEEANLLERYEAANASAGCSTPAGCNPQPEEVLQARAKYNAHEDEAQGRVPLMLGLTIGGVVAITAAVIWRLVEPAPKTAHIVPFVGPKAGDRAGLRLTF